MAPCRTLSPQGLSVASSWANAECPAFSTPLRAASALTLTFALAQSRVVGGYAADQLKTVFIQNNADRLTAG
eukprot:scaffold145952_cov28-Prasinocladus_malaysianus.AAC.1